MVSAAARRYGRLDPGAVPISEQRGELWTLSYAQHAMAYAAWRLARLDDAARYARECLRIKEQFADQMGIAHVIELLAWITAPTDRPERAATLLGAARQAWQSFGLPLFGSPVFGDAQEACADRLRHELGTARFEAAFQTGIGLTPDRAVAYALGEAAAPESQPAAPTGVPDVDAERALLTRREQQVAQLVSEGLTNKQIAARLVISTRTAESHVEHIMTKLGLSNRAQIASWVGTWSPDR